MAEIDAMARRCEYTQYLEKYLTYPPKGKLPLPGRSVEFDPYCDVWTAIFEAAITVNPAFDIYRIFDTVRSFTCNHPVLTLYFGSSILSYGMF